MSKKALFVIRPSRARGGKLSIRVLGDEEGSVRDAISDADFREGDVVELVLVAQTRVEETTRNGITTVRERNE
jgi:hypothetical protein